MTRSRRGIALGAGFVIAAALFARSFRGNFWEPRYNSRLFRFSRLTFPSLKNPTALQFGPDGALYIATRHGLIHRARIARATPSGPFRASSVETLDAIHNIENHDDHGNPVPGIRGRLVTGFTVSGTADHPVLYVSSSDPRILSPGVDTNSGIVSRLERIGDRWIRTDLVRGLPRSRSDHAPHGVALDPVSRTLYVSVGSNTNMGMPSKEFEFLPEYPLSAAILALDLARLEGRPYDLPTPSGRLFGGLDGRNAATLLPPGAPVRIYATGLRNAYDLTLTPAGIFSLDNGSNAGSGGAPSPGDPAQSISGDDGEQRPNCLFRVSRPGQFLGHANPSRWPAEQALPRSEDLGCVLASTNGLSVYSPRDGRWDGRLLAAQLDGAVMLLHLDQSSQRIVIHERMIASLPGMVVDVWAQNAAEPFPGSIWIAALDDDALYVLDPRMPEASDLRLAVERYRHQIYTVYLYGKMRAEVEITKWIGRPK